MSNYKLIRSFGIDKGELNSFPRHDCFVLGYELALFDQKLSDGKPFSMTIHSANQDRVRNYCDSLERLCTFVWCHEDVSEGWIWVQVGPKSTDSEIS